MASIRPAKWYFLIKINRQAAKQKKHSIGSILIPETQSFMMYNMQCGEIVGIGEKAHESFPEAKIGHTLIIHHFCEGEGEADAKTDHLIHQDDDYNYYVVSCFEIAGKGNEAYGVWDGEKIIPHQDYIFLDVPLPVEPQTPDEYIDSALRKTAGGILTFTNYTENRESKAQKMQRIKGEIDVLTRSGVNKPGIAVEVHKKEEELAQLSLEINARSYHPYTIAAFNPGLKERFGYRAHIEVGATVYVMNQAAQTEIEFKNKKYIVAKASYIGGAISI
jgi:co-chaperonin GroES (HSP10)